MSIKEINGSGGKGGVVILIKLLGPLRREMGRGELELEASAITASELLRLLPSLAGRKDRVLSFNEVMLLINGVEAGALGGNEAVIRDGDEVVLLPLIHGGSSKLSYLAPSWEEIVGLSRKVAQQILRSCKSYDLIVGLARGGLIPARMLSDLLGIETLEVIGCKHYKSALGGREEKGPILRWSITSPLEGKRVLLVDDVVDTGATVRVASEALLAKKPKCVEVAVLYVKPWREAKVHYWASETDAWIIFPWGRMEALRAMMADGSLSEASRLMGEVEVREMLRLVSRDGQEGDG